MAFTVTSSPLNFNTTVSGYGCGVRFEQNCWWTYGFGEKKALIGRFAYTYSTPPPPPFLNLVFF